MIGPLSHASLLLGALLLAWGVGRLSLALASSRPAWGDRRALQLLSLLSPLLLLGTLGAAIAVMLVRGCSVLTPRDALFSQVILGVVGAIALLAAAAAVLRARRVRRRLQAESSPCQDLAVLELANRLAGMLGVAVPRVRVLPGDYPLACVTGWRRPVLILSAWMLTALEADELEAVLAHELAHLRHGDTWLSAVMGWLRHGWFYLPTARAAWTAYQAEREWVADLAAVRVTQRPTALASALLRVWDQAASAPVALSWGAVTGFAEQEAHSIAGRIERLVEGGGAPCARSFGPWAVVAIAAGALLIVAALAPLYFMPAGMGASCLMSTM